MSEVQQYQSLHFKAKAMSNDPQDTHWIPSVLSLSSTPMSQIKLAYKVPFMLHWTTSFLTNTNMKMLC